MIARELLVKLGFDIDSSKLDKFNTSIDATKNKMQAIRNSSLQGIASASGSKLANAISPETNNRASVLKNYHDELASLSKSERAEVLALNKAENQAIKETTKIEKAELKERQRFTRERFKETQTLQRSQQRDFKTSMTSMSSVARKFAILGASITAGFGLSLRSALKDVANFKEGKSSSSFDKTQIATVDAFNKALDSTKSTAANLRNSFVIDMLPAIKETLEVFNAWVQKNKVQILKTLKNVVGGLAAAFKILSSVIKPILIAFNSIINRTIGWKNLITAIVTIGLGAWLISAASSVMPLVRAFKVLSSAILTTNPLVLLIVGAFALLADEILVTLQDGDSFINDFLKSDAWKTTKDSIDAITESLKKMTKAMGMSQKTEFAQRKEKERLLNYQNSDGKFGKGNVKAYTLKESLLKAPFKPKPELQPLSFPEYNPFDRIMDSFRSNRPAAENKINNKNSFVFNLTLPSGTTETQAKDLTSLVKQELEKYTSYQTEKTLAAIGSY
jgi:hypothetical protein